MPDIDRQTPERETGKESSRRPGGRGATGRAAGRRPRKNYTSVLAACIFITAVMIIAVGSIVVKKYSPTKERVDINHYYNIQEKDDMAVILDNERIEPLAKYWDGHVYLEYDTAHDYLNQRFYRDLNENILRYALPSDVVTVEAGAQQYTVSKEKKKTDYVVVKADGDKLYLALDFVQQYTNIDFSVEKKPNRVQITSKWEKIQTAQVNKNTEIRQKGGIKSPIVADVEKGSMVVILEQGENWSKVCTGDGMIGYLKNNKLGEMEEKTISREFEEPEFRHILKDGTVSLGWHQVTSQEGNDRIAKVLQDTKGMNVISPTWFYLNDNKGNVYSLASRSYVDYCHQNGIEVWALISNLENPDVDTAAVLTHTSTRDYLVNQLIAAAIEYDLDGINLDFEALDAEKVGDSYTQFIRELSIKCEKNDIVLSVDNYVPTSYTAFYNRAEQALFADYVIIMGYDEHTKVSEDVGPVASMKFIAEGVENTLKEVPANQIILGMPFYSRVWELTPKDTNGDDAESAKEGYLPYTFTCVEEGMQTVENRFTVNGAQKMFDEESGQNYVEYENGGKTYKIWVEDENSLESRLKIMKENELAGAAYWKMGLERQSAWDMIVKYIS